MILQRVSDQLNINEAMLAMYFMTRGTSSCIESQVLGRPKCFLYNRQVAQLGMIHKKVDTARIYMSCTRKCIIVIRIEGKGN